MGLTINDRSAKGCIAIIAVAALLAIIAGITGFANYRSQLATRANQQLAFVIYTDVQRQDYAAIQRTNLCTEECIGQLQSADNKYGGVDSFRVAGVSFAPTGVPRIVTVYCKRRGKNYTEVLIGNTPDKFDQWARNRH